MRTSQKVITAWTQCDGDSNAVAVFATVHASRRGNVCTQVVSYSKLTFKFKNFAAIKSQPSVKYML